MKREIKFRAWDGKVMLYGVENLHYPLSKYQTSNLMQYTGLRDKHGVEVYEGDVVSCSIPSGDVFGDVGFSDGNYYVTTRERGSGHLRQPIVVMFSDLCGGTMEVIGNIYENPELLTKTTEGK